MGEGFLACQNFFLGPFPVQESFLGGYSPMHEILFVRKYFPYSQFAIELIKKMQLCFTKYIACTVTLLYIFKFILLQNTF